MADPENPQGEYNLVPEGGGEPLKFLGVTLVKVLQHIQTVILTMEILKKVTELVKVLIHIPKKGLKKQKTLILVIGSRIKSMELEYKTIPE